jgi:hypothetical protein
MGLNIDITTLQTRLGIAVGSLDNIIEDTLALHITMGNPECADIMALTSADERQSRFNAYCKRALRKSVQNAGEKLSEITETALRQVEFAIQTAIAEKEAQLQKALAEMQAMSAAAEIDTAQGQTAKYEELIKSLDGILALCA